MSDTKTASFPIFGILGLIFITLKLCDVIAWSWWWVLSPFWIPAAIWLAVVTLFVLVWSLAKKRPWEKVAR